MRIFYEEWSPIIESKSSKSSAMADDLERFLNLSFSHHIIILTEEKDIEKRWKYINLTIENQWNKRFLKAQIKENAADHYGALPSNFGATITNSRDAIKALSMFKDEYLLDFINTEEIGIRDIQDIDERIVEKLREALPDVEDLKKLLAGSINWLAMILRLNLRDFQR